MENLVNLSNLIDDVLGLLKSEEISDIFGDILKDEKKHCTKKHCCKKNSRKEDKNKDYAYYRRDKYVNDELVDHIEKEYKNGKCTLNVDDHKEPETRLSVKSSSPVLDNGCCGKHNCCDEKKSCETKLPDVGYFTKERLLELDEKCHKQWDKIKSLKMDKESLEEENTKLKEIIAELRTENTTFRNKLNEIKKIF